MTALTMILASLFLQVAEPANSQTWVSWDHPGTDQAPSGVTPSGLAGFELASLADGGDPNRGDSILGRRRMEQPDRRQATIGTAIEGLSDGVYTLWLRSFDNAGNHSEWVGGVRVRIGDAPAVDDETPPPAPTNFRIRLDLGLRLEVRDNVATVTLETSHIRVEGD